VTPHHRFAAWRVVILLLLVGQPATLVVLHDRRSGSVIWSTIGFFEAIALLLLALLVTTPADAIRLPPRRSFWLISCGTLLLYVVAVAVHPLRWPTTALAMAAVLLTMVALQRNNRSAWWIVPLAWNPLLLAYFAGVAVY